MASNQAAKKRWRLAAAGLLVAAITALALAWTAYNVIHTVNGQSEYYQVHDYYAENQVMLAADPAEGWTQGILAGPDTPLYGVRLYFSSLDRVVHGTLYVDLLDESGQRLTGAALDMTEILGLDFQGIVFEQPVFPEKDATRYTLHIYYEPATAEDVLGLVYGTGPMPQEVELDENQIPFVPDPDAAVSANAANPAFPLTGSTVQPEGGATAALQYITNYSGSIGLWLCIPVTVVLFAAVMGAWWLIFCKKAGAAACVAYAVAALGLAWSLITPPMAAPDEYTHLAGAYSMASRMMGQPGVETGYDNWGKGTYTLPMRSCDAPYMRNKSGEVGVFGYKQILDHPGGFGNSGQLTERVDVVAPSNPLPAQYLPQALGILLARLLGLGFYPMLWMSRLFSVACYTALTALAVKIAPQGSKEIFGAAALLPMGLSLAGSFSADTTVLGMAFLFTALCVSAMTEKKQGSIGRCAALLVLAALLAPAKAIYLGMVTLVFPIGAEQLGGKLRSRIFKALVCVAALAGWLMANGETVAYTFRSVDTERIRLAVLPALVLGALCGIAWYKLHKKRWFKWAALGACGLILLAGGGTAVWVLANSGQTFTPEELAAGIQPNGESIYTFSVGYILSHLSQTVKLLANTITEQLPVYLQGLVGALPGEPIVHKLTLSWSLTILLLLVPVCASVRRAEQPARLNRPARWVMGLVALSVAGLMVVAALIWTPINATTVFGVQGRYLLPVLPILLLLLGEQNAFCARRDVSRGVRCAAVFVSAAAALQSFALFCGA